MEQTQDKNRSLVLFLITLVSAFLAHRLNLRNIISRKTRVEICQLYASVKTSPF